MSGQSKKSRSVGSWIFWAVLTELVVLFVFIPGRLIDTCVSAEKRMVAGALSVSAADWIDTKSGDLYNTLFVASNVRNEVHAFFIPSGREKERSKGLEKLGDTLIFPFMEDRLEAIFKVFRHFLYRAMAFAVWAPFAPLVLCPAVLDGMMMWRKRQYTFDYASPVVHGSALHMSSVIVLSAPALLLAPIPLHPMVIPVGLLILASLLAMVAAHTQKRI